MAIGDWLKSQVDHYIQGLGYTKARSGGPIPAWLGVEADQANLTPFDGGMNAEQKRRLAMSSSWAYSDIKLIANEVQKVPLTIQRLMGGGETEDVPDHPFRQLMRRPNPFMSGGFLKAWLAMWMNLDGEGYWFLAPNRLGGIAEIWPMDPRATTPVPDRQQFVRSFTYTVRGETFNVPTERVVWFRTVNPFSLFEGLSPLGAAALGLETDHYARVYNRDFYGQRQGVPATIVSAAEGTGDPDMERLAEMLKAGFNNQDKRVLLTRAGDLSVGTIGFNLTDMGLMASRDYTQKEMDRIFGVPPAIWDASANGRSIVDQAERRLMKGAIQPLVDYVADELTAQVIQPYYGEDLMVTADNVVPEDRELQRTERELYWFAKTLDEVRADLDLDAHPNPQMGEKMFAEVAGRMTQSGPGSGVIPLGGLEDAPSAEDQIAAVKADLRRWRSVALREVRDGKDPAGRYFESAVIPPTLREQVAGGLRGATSEQEVKAVFEAPFRRLDDSGGQVSGRGLYRQGYP